jgi:HTH-type transcriptional regulator/antitoxin HigA
MIEMSEFRPNWASAPGDTIAEVLEEKRISIGVFSKSIGYSVDEAKDLLAGRVAITLALARKLQLELGSSAEFWMSRDFRFRSTVARLNDAESRDWLTELPVGDMVRFKWMPPVSPSQELAACLRFFDVPDVAAWTQKYAYLQRSVAFRTSASFESRAGAVAAWLRQGEIESQPIRCRAWNPDLFSAGLVDIRNLTRRKDPTHFLPDLRSVCASAGVAVVIVRAPNGCRASGATYFLSEEKAVLQLSFRHLADDQFWFSFFHEAGHLLLHGRDGFFLEGIGATTKPEEQEANDFAEGTLVPLELRPKMLALRADSREVISFARRLGVSPGIVVGQLQHHGRIKPSYLNGLKRRYMWGD